MCHGEQAAIDAEATAQQVFEQGSVGDDLPSIDVTMTTLEGGLNILDLFVDAGLASSKGDVKRLIKGGGAKINDATITDMSMIVTPTAINEDGIIKLSSGKKKHALIKVT